MTETSVRFAPLDGEKKKKGFLHLSGFCWIDICIGSIVLVAFILFFLFLCVRITKRLFLVKVQTVNSEFYSFKCTSFLKILLV